VKKEKKEKKEKTEKKRRKRDREREEEREGREESEEREEREEREGSLEVIAPPQVTRPGNPNRFDTNCHDREQTSSKQPKSLSPNTPMGCINLH
jgi:hypothetical protein